MRNAVTSSVALCAPAGDRSAANTALNVWLPAESDPRATLRVVGVDDITTRSL